MTEEERDSVVVPAVEEGREEVEKLTDIKNELEEINSKVGPSRWRVLRNGMYQGAGVVAGGAIAVVLIGWLLSIIGVIPGFHETAEYLQSVIEARR